MNSTISVRVLFFSVLRDLTGVHELNLEIAEESLLEDLLATLFDRWPGLREWDTSLLLAVDHHYRPRSTPLTPGCEVAVMPPVQGG